LGSAKGVKTMGIRRLTIVLILSVFILVSFSQVEAANRNQTKHNLLIWGYVTQIISENTAPTQHARGKVTNQIVRVKLISGKFKGQEIVVTNMFGLNPVYDIKVKKGDGVVVALDLVNGKIKDAGITDRLREPWVYILIALFILLLLLVCRKKGMKALITLLLTLGVILGILLPGLLRGYDPVILTVAVAIVVAIINIIIIAGWSRKSFASIGGTIGGLIIAGIIALVIGKAAHLTGFGNEESAMLLYLPQNIKLNIQGLLFAGIIIGALGAVMDVSMSVASAIEEVRQANPNLTVPELIRSGMNVGRDITGIMANTLILAYTGSSISLLLMFMAYRDTMTLIMNLDVIASEIVRALSGSIGMIIVVPLTATVAGLLFGKQPPSTKEAATDKQPEEKEYDFMREWSNHKPNR
jgi:uncharacterized membrane protein